MSNGNDFAFRISALRPVKTGEFRTETNTAESGRFEIRDYPPPTISAFGPSSVRRGAGKSVRFNYSGGKPGETYQVFVENAYGTTLNAFGSGTSAPIQTTSSGSVSFAPQSGFPTGNGYRFVLKDSKGQEVNSPRFTVKLRMGWGLRILSGAAVLGGTAAGLCAAGVICPDDDKDVLPTPFEPN